MENEKINLPTYVGIGWQNIGGVVISLKKEEIEKLEADSYGSVKLFVGLRKSVCEKSKATHFVKLDVKKN